MLWMQEGKAMQAIPLFYSKETLILNLRLRNTEKFKHLMQKSNALRSTGFLQQSF